MTAIVFELFDRFLAHLSAGKSATLFADEAVRAETSKVVDAPLCSVLMKARDNKSELPFAVIVLTSPELSTDDTRLLEYAARKARAHKAPYFVTWTLRDLCIWSTPRPGTPATRDTLEKLRDYADLYEISPSSDSLPEPTKLAVLARGRELMRDLDRLFRDESLELVEIDATYFVGRLIDAVHRLVPLVSDSLHLRLDSDLQFREEIATWAVRQGIAGDPRDSEFAESIARQIVYRLLGKILFYQSLRRSARHLPDLVFHNVDTSQVLSTLRAAFARASEIDYHAVFAEDVPDRIQWPSGASHELVDLIRDFHTRDFAHVPQDVIGIVFERLIPPEERHGLGQYFTPENLCDLIIAFCVQSAEEHVLDPTCGTGTFLIRAYERMQSLGLKDHVKLLSRLWGIDIAPFPAELATINLFRQRVAEHENFPRIICRDVFSVSPHETFKFPPPKMDYDNPAMVEHALPQFSAIVGNFPFIRQEKIEKLVPGYKRHLERVIAEGWFESYPEAFQLKSKAAQRQFERARNQKRSLHHFIKEAELRLSGKADILAYLFFQVARFVAPRGRMGIITSNAWLDVDYGYELQKFLLNNFKIVAILESRCEPWFTEADVNTIVTILERCESSEDRADHLAKFVKIKKPLATLIPGVPNAADGSRWKKTGNLVGRLENSGRKYHQMRPLGLITEEEDDFRVRICRQEELLAEIERQKRTAKWGVLLRAPEVFFALRKQSKIPFEPIGRFASVVNGFVTRINDFFYLTPKAIEEFGIEEEFIKPVLRSPREFRSLQISNNELKSRVFLCPFSKEQLRKKGKRGALSYIKWGEAQKTSDGVPWPEGPSVKDRKPGWWSLGLVEPAQLFWAEHLGEVLAHRFSLEPIYADHNLHLVRANPNSDPELLAALVNSTLGFMLQETVARQSLGGGASKMIAADIENEVLIPKPDLISAKSARAIKTAFRELSGREVGSIFEEVKRADRRTFDSAVLEAIGLEPRKYLRSLYDQLCEIVGERIELGKTRGKERKTRSRTGRAEKQVSESVLDEILPEGPKRFPQDFFSIVAVRDKRISIPLPESPLIFDSGPFTMGLYTKDRSFSRDAKNPSEAKFLIYAQQAGHKVADLPEKPVEVSRTVANYEKYLRELRTQLYETYYRRTLDHSAAARLTQSAFDRFRLPTVSN